LLPPRLCTGDENATALRSDAQSGGRGGTARREAHAHHRRHQGMRYALTSSE